MEVIYISSDKSLEIKLVFSRRRRLKYTHLGKGWPIHTQCLLYSNGLVDAVSTIVKHAKDEDSPKDAYLIAADRVLQNIENKWLRSQVKLELEKSLKSF